MKILRKRRGFTTNSSSASEWATATPGSQTTPAYKGTPVPVGAEIVVYPQGVTPAPTPGATSGINSTAMANVFILGGVALVVAGSLVVERLWRRRKK